jgi:outer membrane protein OmpU
MKRFLFGAILTTFAGAANAQSSLTLTGIVGGGFRWASGISGGPQIGYSNNILAGNSFGLRGSEDLGGGVKAIFTLINSFNSGDGTLSNSAAPYQDAYVGLTGDFGRVTFGRQLNASEDLAVVLDPSAARGQSFAIVPEVAYSANVFTLDSRFNNTIKYLAKLGGLSMGGSYSPGGIAGSSRANSNFSFSMLYQYQTLIGGAAYEKTYNATGSQWAQTMEVGGAWQIGAARLYLSYTTLAVSSGSATLPQRRDKVVAGGLVYRVTPAIQLTAALYDDIADNLSNSSGANGHKLTTYAIAEYFLTKRTELYVEVDRNGFSGAYSKDPTNIYVFNLRPGARTSTGLTIGFMTQF